jgi:hypothetical protein
MVQRHAEGNGEIVEERKMVGKKNDQCWPIWLLIEDGLVG